MVAADIVLCVLCPRELLWVELQNPFQCGSWLEDQIFISSSFRQLGGLNDEV
jgi:hypothetical protein